MKNYRWLYICIWLIYLKSSFVFALDSPLGQNESPVSSSIVDTVSSHGENITEFEEDVVVLSRRSIRGGYLCDCIYGSANHILIVVPTDVYLPTRLSKGLQCRMVLEYMQSAMLIRLPGELHVFNTEEQHLQYRCYYQGRVVKRGHTDDANCPDYFCLCKKIVVD